MNRIAANIEKTTKLLDRDPVTHSKLKQLDEKKDSCKLDWKLFYAFQEVKSFAFAMGFLSLDEATTIYAVLGNGPEHFNRQPLATRFVLTTTFAELLNWRLKMGTAQTN